LLCLAPSIPMLLTQRLFGELLCVIFFPLFLSLAS
jgi:hypothetical protein